MPSPTLLEWCSSSISSLHQSVNQMITSYSKLEQNFSSIPSIAAIQSIKGDTPQEKLKELNLIAKSIVESAKEKGELRENEEFAAVPSYFSPWIRIVVGAELKISDYIIDGLNSSRTDVMKKALKADWFFENSELTPEFFVTNIIPSISSKTRNRLIKKLSNHLKDNEDKAERLFKILTDLYGIESSSIILTHCSENFVIESIVKYKIKLSLKDIESLYAVHPEIVIRYLQLGIHNKEHDEIFQEHEIILHDYDAFLPKLLKKHPQKFAEFYRVTPEKIIKLSNSLALVFLKNLKHDLVKEPNIFLKLLPLKIISRRLSRAEFEEMFENMLPKEIEEFGIDQMLDLLEFYQHDKFQLLQSKYLKVYNDELLQNKTVSESMKFIKILPAETRENYVKSLLEKHKKSDSYGLYVSYLPPKESMECLKNRFIAASNAEARAEIVHRMIMSCSLHESKEDLLRALQYYHEKHISEENPVFCSFLQSLMSEFDLKSLDQENFSALLEIIDHAHVKKDLFKSHISLVESVLIALLENAVSQDENESLLDNMTDKIIECKVENLGSNWNIFKHSRDLEKKFLEKFFHQLPCKYPRDHRIWKKSDDRLALCLSVVKSINDYNIRHAGLKKKSRKVLSTDLQSPDVKIKIEDYPWFMCLTDEFFHHSENESSIRRTRLLQLIQKNAPEFYEAKLNEHMVIRNIDTGEALALLKQKPKKILLHWPEYLTEAREKLQNGSKAARRFIAATKWHTEISSKFIERCLVELEKPGSFLVLGILVEGDAFESLVATYAPVEGALESTKTDARERFETIGLILRAMQYTDPPVSLEALSSFCQGDYVSLAEGPIFSIASRVPADKVIEAAEKMLQNPEVSVRKIAIRLMAKVATRPQLKDLLETLKSDTEPKIRRIASKMVFKLMLESNWELVKQCIDGLTLQDSTSLEMFADVESVGVNYLSSYVEEYLNKIETLYKVGLSHNMRTKCVCLLFEGFDAKLMNHLSEETATMMLKKYFFDTDSLEISRVVQNFAVRVYLIPSGVKFEARLKTILDLFTRVLRRCDTPHPKKARFYPANYTTQQFFNDCLTEISCCNSFKHKMDVVENLLKLFASATSPWKEPRSYITLSLYKEYLRIKMPRDFGIRCAKQVPSLIEHFIVSESVINDVAECVEDMLLTKIYKNIKYPDKKLSVIEGMIAADDYYGSLMGAKLLNANEVEDYDERYDAIIKSLRMKQNKAIQYNLYKHLNTIQYDDSDIWNP
ncbi:hypothetical protein QAD02_010887 [Eretmocerus hayati]|uniref:Uncharacterized protein n=1 Tax=Eretmocerus hayati TaxID=131215 RepID=A0ACC2NWX3_9HYME|nr:hypothetical protein QAD02_010887 [Eretmocerus hayati]